MGKKESTKVVTKPVIFIFNKAFLPAVAISTPTAVIYSMDSHSIACDITDIPAQITGVEWISGTNVASLGLAPQDGTISGTSQTSTLALSSEQLVKLKTAGGSNPAHVFTCKITVGTSSTPLQATQTISIYTPGKCLLNSHWILAIVNVECIFLCLLHICDEIKRVLQHCFRCEMLLHYLVIYKSLRDVDAGSRYLSSRPAIRYTSLAYNLPAR